MSARARLQMDIEGLRAAIEDEREPVEIVKLERRLLAAQFELYCLHQRRDHLQHARREGVGV